MTNGNGKKITKDPPRDSHWHVPGQLNFVRGNALIHLRPSLLLCVRSWPCKSFTSVTLSRSDDVFLVIIQCSGPVVLLSGVHRPNHPQRLDGHVFQVSILACRRALGVAPFLHLPIAARRWPYTWAIPCGRSAEPTSALRRLLGTNRVSD